MINLSTPAKRRHLEAGTIHWTAIGGARNSLKLGYRRGGRGSSWIAKIVHEGHRAQVVLGPADDAEDALTHQDAIRKAADWAAREKARIATSIEAENLPPTVADAVKHYVAQRIAKNAKAGMDAKYRLGAYVSGNEKFATLPLARVTVTQLTQWRSSLPATLKPATVNRLLNDLKACLRAAVERHWRDLPSTIGKEIEVGLRGVPNAEKPRHALLTDADIRKVIDAACGIDEDLGTLVLVLAATGGRFSQVAQLTVADVQASAARVMLPVSAKGRGSKVRSRIAVPVGRDVIERLMPMLSGRAGHEILLQRWMHRQVSPTEWVRVERAAWDAASLMQRGWRKALAAAGVAVVEPYALRHSSIMRQLREGLPTRLVASLHDTSVPMIERNYAFYIADALDEVARRAIVPLASAPVVSRKAVGYQRRPASA
jgi:integrase